MTRPFQSAWQKLPSHLSAYGKGELRQAQEPGALADALVHQTGERWMTVGFHLFLDSDEQAWLLVSFPRQNEANLTSKLTELGNVLASRLAMGLEALPVVLAPPTELAPKRWQQILGLAREVTQQLYAYHDDARSIPMQLTLLSGLKAEGISAGGRA
jgi:hypothetical protein